MFRYLPCILLVQIVTLSLFWVSRDNTLTHMLTTVALPAMVVSSAIALWFSALSRMDTQKANAKLVAKHFAEREKLTQKLERNRSEQMQRASADQAKILERAGYEREKLMRQTHQDMMKAERSATRRANMKVGGALSLLIVAGVGLLFVQFMTLGLLTITAAGSALGGYLLRWKQTRHVMQLASEGATSSLQIQDGRAQSAADGPSKPIIIDADESPKDKRQRQESSSA